MTMMTCPPAEQLKAFYLGQLPDDRSDELVAHVSVCSACQAELETVVDAEDSLIAHLREPDTGSELDREPACELGMLRALGALATANEPTADESNIENKNASLPKTIGEYEIVRALAQGGMGHVYLARHSKLGRMVALKILAGHRLGDRRASQRFEAEMRAIGRLSHPNIVTAHDAREIDGTAVLVTEFIDGFDLGQLLQRTGPLAVADACEIIRQVALALQYTSEQGFVHRDVKPSNIMLSASGEVKLLDLGLARLQFGDVESADVTGTGQTMGTADYISPEQVTDSRKVDVRSDIYSLGATLFKLLVGRAPFADEKHNTAFAKMTAHVSTAPATLRSLRSDVPEELSRLVTSLLAKRPEDRPQTPESIAAKLSAFAAGSDLAILARKAALVSLPQTNLNSVMRSIEPKTLTQSFWHRPVKLYVAIASGLIGVLLGICFGIIITITNPDGSKTVMTLPEGSKVELSEGEKAHLQSNEDPAQAKTKSLLGAPAPTYNGHTLDEWLTLLQTEKSRNGQIAAIEGLKGLRSEQNTAQIFMAAVASIDSRKSQSAEEFELVRLLLGPERYGQWLIALLNKNQSHPFTKSILINHTDSTWKSPPLRPEHFLIAEWLADPKHQLAAEDDPTDASEIAIQYCVQSFLTSMFYSPELKGDTLETCFRAARNQTAIGDTDTFLLGIPCERGPHAASKFPEDERLRYFAELAINKLLTETSDVLQATRAMSILIAYPKLIPDDKAQALTEVLQKRFAALLQSPERIDSLVDKVESHFVITSIQSASKMYIWHPRESRCSETLSLLYLTYFLGAPPELAGPVATLRERTQPDYERAVGIWQEWTAQKPNTSENYLTWPFDQATNEKLYPEVISGIGSNAWRAAYYDLIATRVQLSFERRKAAANELAGSDAVNFLGAATRAFARIDRGIGYDFQMHNLNANVGRDNEYRATVMRELSDNFKTIDANGDGKITLSEYARYLADKAKQQVNTGTQSIQHLFENATEPKLPSSVPKYFLDQQKENFARGLIDLFTTMAEYIKAPRKTNLDQHDTVRLAETFLGLANNLDKANWSWPQDRFQIRNLPQISLKDRDLRIPNSIRVFREICG